MHPIVATLLWPLSAAAICGLSLGCRSAQGSEAPATPQRPTLSSDTSTTPEGLFELEAGFVRDSTISFDSPFTLKYGSGPRTEISLGIAPYRRVDLGADEVEGPGDAVIAIRHRLSDDPKSPYQWAVQALVKVPTADDPILGTGELDAALAAIVSRAFDGYSAVGYYSLGALGDPEGPALVTHNLALALGVPLTARVGAFGEVAAVLVPESDVENIFTTLGATYSPDPSLVFDAGVVLGLSDEASDWQALIGLTKNLGRLTGDRP